MTDAAQLVLVREIEEFLFHEARLLDQRRFEDWMALYTDDATYWVPAKPDQQNPIDTISIYYDDRRMMETRVKRLRHPANYAQSPPSRTQHLVTNVVIEEVDDATGEIETDAGFMMVEYRDEEQQLYGGSVRHRLRRTNGGLMIASKRVDLLNCDAPHGPMSIPF